MESMKTHLVVWLSGVITGLILMERWRRFGDPSGATAQNGGAATVTDTARPASSVGKPKGLKLIATGAMSEAERVRLMVTQMMPWAKDVAASPFGNAPTRGPQSSGSFEGDEGLPPQ